ncbi:MAG TPA: cytochrome b/b6 domain-containing protein [Acidobacteriaceae bacterium]|jgi:cytochrome b subunit of formate dehydrogenase|nr:cytochrome b/b6 domain-containing protein [Acidobacteriaceae bacterium]
MSESLEVIATPIAADGAVAAVPAEAAKERYFVRFTLGQRYLHGVLFTTFLGLAGTGLPLRFSSTPWAIRFARITDGFGTILFFHKFCALVLTLAFLVHVREIIARGIFKRDRGIFWGPTSMVANWKDVKDLFGHMRWFLGLGPKPKFERYAYWEKFDYWAVFWGMVVIGFSGYAMWFAPFFARFLPGWALNAALVIHSEEGLLAILFIFSIHFVNTHLRPDSFPMDMVIFTGRESEEEYKNRRPEEYQRMVKEGRSAIRITDAPPKWLINFSRVVGFTAILIGLTLLILTLTAYIAG